MKSTLVGRIASGSSSRLVCWVMGLAFLLAISAAQVLAYTADTSVGGNWTNPATWNDWEGQPHNPAGYPGGAGYTGDISKIWGGTVTVNTNITNSTVYGYGGTLNVPAGITLTATWLDERGTLNLSGSINATTFDVEAGGVVNEAASATVTAGTLRLNNAAGTFSYNLNGGTITAGTLLLDNPGSGGTFSLNSGTLAVGGGGLNFKNNANILKIVGTGTTITNGGPLTFNNSSSWRGTLQYAFTSSGVTPLPVTGTANLAWGTLTLGLKDPIARFTTTSFPLISATTTISTDFTTKNLDLFTTSSAGGTYTANLDSAQRVFTAPNNLKLAAQEQIFLTAANKGWFGIDTTGLSGGMMTLYLDVNGSAGDKTTLLNTLQTAGYYAAPMSYGIYDLQLGLPNPTPGSTVYFAYDLSTVGTGSLQVGAAQLPEPATLALLALGGLVALRRRSRRA